MPLTHLLYLHGFRSSPQSAKARLMAQAVAQRLPRVQWYCPQLPPSPRDAMRLLTRATADWPADSMAVLGSSLGGFYATWVAEQRGCPAVLINPAVDPARDLQRYIGQQNHWHAPEESFYFAPHYVDELRTLQCGALRHPDHYLVLMATGDEVLDWREMRTRYRNSHLLIHEGGDHAFGNFADYLPQVFAHLLGTPAN